jgi:hypothetical protein
MIIITSIDDDTYVTTYTSLMQAHLELGQPLLLEVARYLSAPAGDTASDPAFGAYHALLQFPAAAEQLQELGALNASGSAVPVAAMAWAVQQGKSAAALPGPSAPSRCVLRRRLGSQSSKGYHQIPLASLMPCM